MKTCTPEKRAHILQSKHWVGYPVDPLLMAEREGIIVRHSTLSDDVAGVLARENPQKPIIAVINTKITYHLQKTTMARILGHYTRLKTEDKINERFGILITDFTEL